MFSPGCDRGLAASLNNVALQQHSWEFSRVFTALACRPADSAGLSMSSRKGAIMWTKTLTLAVMGVAVAVAGCTTSRTHLLPSYVLDNGQRLQDVVTVAGDSTGDAPSLTVVKTYDVSSAGQTVLVSHDTASAPSVGTVIAGGVAGAIPHAAAAVGIAAIHNKRRPVVSANITTNVANANENNSAASSDNAVDVNNTASADNNNAVDVVNAAVSDATAVAVSVTTA
jgi:hypothetical protein